MTESTPDAVSRIEITNGGPGTESEVKAFTSVIRLTVERGASGAIFITSPDDHGLIVSGANIDKALSAVPAAMRALFQSRTILGTEQKSPEV